MTKKNIVTRDIKMADVIHMNYLLLPVINRFDIKLGFGDKTVEQVCSEYGINLSFFLDIINTYHDPKYFPLDKMREYPINLIVNYLLKSHEHYTQKMLPETEQMIDELVHSCRGDCDNLRLIEDFYKKYKTELENHLKSEEEKFFPYVKALIDKKEKEKNLEAIRRKYNFSYASHSIEHESVITKLLDLKNILIKYLPPDYDHGKCNNLLYWLFLFEDDLRDHERLEDVILLPALENIEAQYRQNK
ncbi:MAG: hemerythrin domain-containing protein [Bacteroidales bacterium]|nr:hemerythrin domain-containing protein [Bacteroidales bacterium]